MLLVLFGLARGDDDLGLSGADELRGAVDILHREGEVARDQRDMFGGLLELEDVPVGDVMIHRTKMRTLDADLPPAELVREALGFALHADAAMARRARQHHRHPAHQGPVPRV